MIFGTGLDTGKKKITFPCCIFHLHLIVFLLTPQDAVPGDQESIGWSPQPAAGALLVSQATCALVAFSPLNVTILFRQ